jgi:hypothetical protein
MRRTIAAKQKNKPGKAAVAAMVVVGMGKYG